MEELSDRNACPSLRGPAGSARHDGGQVAIGGGGGAGAQAGAQARPKAGAQAALPWACAGGAVLPHHRQARLRGRERSLCILLDTLLGKHDHASFAERLRC